MPAVNPEKVKVATQVSRREMVFALAREPQSRRVFFGGSDFAVYAADLAEAKPDVKELGRHESYVTGLALAAGAVLVSGGYDGRLNWWDTRTLSKLRSIEAHRKWVRKVVATPDGSAVASVADDMVCRLWDAATGRLIREFHGHDETTPHHYPSMLFAVAASPDGRFLASADKVGRINVWEIESGQQAARVEAPTMYTWDPVQRRHSIGGIRALTFSPDGSRLAAGGIGQIGNIDHLDGKARVEVFDWRKGERTHEFPGDKINGLVEHLEFLPGSDGRWLLAAGGANDGFLLAFDLDAKKVVTQEKMPMHVHDFSPTEDGSTLLAVGDKKLIVVSLGD